MSLLEEGRKQKLIGLLRAYEKVIDPSGKMVENITERDSFVYAMKLVSGDSHFEVKGSKETVNYSVNFSLVGMAGAGRIYFPAEVLRDYEREQKFEARKIWNPEEVVALLIEGRFERERKKPLLLITPKGEGGEQ